MRFFGKGSLFSLALVALLIARQPQAYSQGENQTNIQTADEQLLARANQERAQVGAGRLQWDPALAAAALYHCRRMAAEGPIAHQYRGEPDLASRAGEAGAHFSLIEENVAVGSSADIIHDSWMHSPGHRTNLLNPEVNRVGIAVVASRGVLYAVADYSQVVQSLTAIQVESRVAALIRQSGLSILADPSLARAACATNEGVPRSPNSPQPGFVMRWQGSDLTRLPPALVNRMDTRRYHRAAVGSCPAQGLDGSFTAYRVAVLLF
ncbi:MAG TPA: CAP domain-containing protein [Terracidiphilus sp.]|nr:CAP domain-containing protein [Terracidiphilus sp.]HEV2488050.1 CAP domain-containing protein [Terracidiphilus sp.]